MQIEMENVVERTEVRRLDWSRDAIPPIFSHNISRAIFLVLSVPSSVLGQFCPRIDGY